MTGKDYSWPTLPRPRGSTSDARESARDSTNSPSPVHEAARDLSAKAVTSPLQEVVLPKDDHILPLTCTDKVDVDDPLKNLDIWISLFNCF